MLGNESNESSPPITSVTGGRAASGTAVGWLEAEVIAALLFAVLAAVKSEVSV
jgi:hypothetical protein